MTTRRGKIARLPQAVREELNVRMQNGAAGADLVIWLNGLPEVKRVLVECFDGRPITEQNISEYRKRGFEECVLRQQMLAQAREMSTHPDENEALLASGLPDNLASVVALGLADVLTNWNGEMTPAAERKVRALGRMCDAIVKLRKQAREKLRVEG